MSEKQISSSVAAEKLLEQFLSEFFSIGIGEATKPMVAWFMSTDGAGNVFSFIVPDDYTLRGVTVFQGNFWTLMLDGRSETTMAALVTSMQTTGVAVCAATTNIHFTGLNIPLPKLSRLSLSGSVKTQLTLFLTPGVST